MKNEDIGDLHRAPAATATDRRVDSIDILRGLALFGVLIVNLVTEFRVSIFAQFLPQPPEADPIDRAVMHVVRYALELKAFALFSFLFGLGMAMQFERLSATARAHYWLTRRLLVLLGFGLIHLLLIWNGDILTEYAVAGLMVLPLLYASRKLLGFAAIALFALYVALPALPLSPAWPDPLWIERHVEQANQVYRSSNWLQVMRFSVRELPSLLPLHVYILPRTLGLFVLGMLAWRSGVFGWPALHRAKILALAGLLGAIGLVVSASEHGTLANLAPVCLALAFAGTVLFAAGFKPALNLLRPFADIGRMAFTNYIAQSIIFGLIFFGYGLGQFGRLRATPVFVLGLAVYMAQAWLSRVWLRHYRFGPIEWAWRTLMYGRRQAMKRRR